MSIRFFRKLRNRLFLSKKVKTQLKKIEEKLEFLDDSLTSTKVDIPLVNKSNRSNGSVLRIAFILQHNSIWPVWRSIIDSFMRDDRVVVDVVLTQYFHPYASAAVSYDDTRNTLMEADVPFRTSDTYSLDHFLPHVVFVQNPYEETRPSYFKINEFIKRDIKLVYVPYGLEIGGGRWNIVSQFDLDVQRYAWRIFVRSVRHQKMYSKYCRSGSGHVVVTGHPKFDAFLNVQALEYSDKITYLTKNRKVLLWTPHFAVGLPPTWSTYRLYSSFILEYIKSQPEILLIIRPHPLFFQSMRENEVWDSEGEAQFHEMINSAENITFDNNLNPYETFILADALLTDVGSFLLEFLPTQKPILYLHHPEGLGMNDDGDLMNYLYTASNDSDIKDFIDMILEEEDPKKTIRKDAIDEYLTGLDGNVGRRITDHIVNALKNHDDSSPALKNCNDFQVKSENYWVNAQDTYLAPKEYYNKRETVLNHLLMNLGDLNDVIDIGCGDGRYSRLFAQFANEVIAYDISPTLIDAARHKAEDLGVNNIIFNVAELDDIKPLRKFSFVVCMGVTSCLIDDVKFIRLIDTFKELVKRDGHLLLIDTLSVGNEQSASDGKGYNAKYRSVDEYLKLIGRRDFNLKNEILIKEIPERKLVNKLFLFTSSPNDAVIH